MEPSNPAPWCARSPFIACVVRARTRRVRCARSRLSPSRASPFFLDQWNSVSTKPAPAPPGSARRCPAARLRCANRRPPGPRSVSRVRQSFTLSGLFSTIKIFDACPVLAGKNYASGSVRPTHGRMVPPRAPSDKWLYDRLLMRLSAARTGATRSAFGPAPTSSRRPRIQGFFLALAGLCSEHDNRQARRSHRARSWSSRRISSCSDVTTPAAPRTGPNQASARAPRGGASATELVADPCRERRATFVENQSSCRYNAGRPHDLHGGRRRLIRAAAWAP
jgi:hypothetical protein